MCGQTKRSSCSRAFSHWKGQTSPPGQPAAALGSWGCRNKALQREVLQTTGVLAQLWGQEVQNQDVLGVGSSWSLQGRTRPRPSPSCWWVLHPLAFLGLWTHPFSLCLVFIWASLCPSLSLIRTLSWDRGSTLIQCALIVIFN